MAKTIKPEQLGAALQEELTLYHKEATDRVNTAGSKSIKKLVKLTKASAPVGKRGKFRGSITSQETTAGNGMKVYTWGAKAPAHRLTHLLVHGHAAKDGSRVPGSSFLQSALDVVLPEYENAVKEALQND
jgi:hypothetical protein